MRKITVVRDVFLVLSFIKTYPGLLVVIQPTETDRNENCPSTGVNFYAIPVNELGVRTSGSV